MFERGLAYRKRSTVNWCPVDNTVLANEQVVDGACWRCGSVVEQRSLEQWFFKITAYADELLAGLDTLSEWPEKVVVMQRNWIGRSEGARLKFPVGRRVGRHRGLYYTNRHDLRRDVRRAGARASAGRHVRGAESADPAAFSERVAGVPRARTRTLACGGKEGFDTGQFALNPFTGEQVPIWVGELRPRRVRNRRDHGGPGPRRARLRVRAQVQAPDTHRRPVG